MGRCRSVHLGLEERLFARMHRMWGPYSLLGLFLHGPTTSKPRNKTLTECLSMNHIAYIRAMFRGGDMVIAKAAGDNGTTYLSVICIVIANAALTTWATRDALAGEAWTCQLRDQSVACSSGGRDATERSLSLAKKMTDVIELLKGTRCHITDFDSRGETVSNSPLMIASLLKDTTEQWRRVGETGHKVYQFDCETYFKYYARGFDTYMDGRAMHWDTLTERLPWQSRVRARF